MLKPFVQRESARLRREDAMRIRESSRQIRKYANRKPIEKAFFPTEGAILVALLVAILFLS